jgi:hypothetical protein
MRVLALLLRHTPATVATLVFGIRAWGDVVPRSPDTYPWDSFVPYISLACGLGVLWVAMSAVCAGARWALNRLHWALRVVAFVALVALAITVPLLLLAPMLAASAVCPRGCEIGANWDGFVIVFDMAIRPNLVEWPVIAAMTVAGAVLMARVERRLTNRHN